jgi:hypothetical protein
MSSLQQLFTTQFDANTIKQVRLMNGDALLYKRLQSSQWQVRFKLANNKWHSTTTNTDDIEQGKINAIAIVETVKIKTDAGLALTTKTFKQIALDEVKNMTSAINNNTGRYCYRDYIFAINKYLIPFFGAYEVEKITHSFGQPYFKLIGLDRQYLRNELLKV